MLPPYSPSVTTSELSRLCGLSRRTVVGWVGSHGLPSYKLALNNQARYIRLDDALTFCHHRHIPCEPLEHHAERCGAVPMANPSVLVCSPRPSIAATFGAIGWSVTMAQSPVQAGITLASRHFLATVIDGAFPSDSVRDLLVHSDGAGVLALMASEDDSALPSAWKERGFDVVYQMPCDLNAVAKDVRTMIVRKAVR
jgi:hypothetical protein